MDTPNVASAKGMGFYLAYDRLGRPAGGETVIVWTQYGSGSSKALKDRIFSRVLAPKVYGP